MTFGEWEGSANKLDAAQLEMAEVAGYCWRHYTNCRTRQKVSILLICGRPGPISVHTPDVCYGGAGYNVVGSLEHYTTESPAGSADFTTACFCKPGPVAEPLRIFWAWSVGRRWAAPDNPRFSFAGSAALYKLYVIRPLASADEPLNDGVSVEFISALLPELQNCLSPEGSSP
jgi:hypothetical protein